MSRWLLALAVTALARATAAEWQPGTFIADAGDANAAAVFIGLGGEHPHVQNGTYPFKDMRLDLHARATAFTEYGVLLIGGYNKSTNATVDFVDRLYLSGNDTNTNQGTLPAPRQGMRAAYTRDKLIIACGGRDELKRASADCFVREGAFGTWKLGTGMPKPRVDHAMVNVRGGALVLGGQNEGECDACDNVWLVQASIDLYWMPRAPMPVGLRAHAAVAVNEDVVVVCGGANATVMGATKCYAYSMTRDEWSDNVGELMYGRYAHHMVVVNGVVYVVGGLGAKEAYTVERYDPIFGGEPMGLNYSNANFAMHSLYLGQC